MRGYILTYSRLKMESIYQLLGFNRGHLNFCVRRTPVPVCRGEHEFRCCDTPLHGSPAVQSVSQMKMGLIKIDVLQNVRIRI